MSGIVPQHTPLRQAAAIEQAITRVSGQPLTVQFVVSERASLQVIDSNQTTTLPSVVLQVGQLHFVR